MTRDEFLASHGLTKSPKLAAMSLGQVEKWYRATAYEPVYTEEHGAAPADNDLVGDLLKSAREYGSQSEIDRLEKMAHNRSVPVTARALDAYKWVHIRDGWFMAKSTKANNEWQRWMAAMDRIEMNRAEKAAL